MTLSARIEGFRLRLHTAVPTGHGSIRERAGLLVGLDDGTHVGWGEASPLPGWSTDSLSVTESALREALGLVTADDDVPGVLDSLTEHPYARTAVSGAWADLEARREGVPLAATLADPWRREVEVNAVLAGTDPVTLESDAAAAVESGYASLKVKVGSADPRADVERVKAVRRGGPEAEIRLDANRAWDRDTAIDVLRSVSEENVAWCEEPTPRPDDFAAIASAAGVRVASDESLSTEADLVAALAAGISVVVLKPQAIGGPDRTGRWAVRARQAAATVVVTSFMDSAVGVAHALHVAAAFGDPIAHGLATAELMAQDVGPGPSVVRGVIDVPAAAGIGFDPVRPESLRSDGWRPS